MAENHPSCCANLTLLFCFIDLILTPIIFYYLYPIYDIVPNTLDTILQLILFIIGMLVYVIGLGSYFGREFSFRSYDGDYENEVQVKAGFSFHYILAIILPIYLPTAEYWYLSLFLSIYLAISTCIYCICLRVCTSSSSEDDEDSDSESSRLIESV